MNVFVKAKCRKKCQNKTYWTEIRLTAFTNFKQSVVNNIICQHKKMTIEIEIEITHCCVLCGMCQHKTIIRLCAVGQTYLICTGLDCHFDTRWKSQALLSNNNLPQNAKQEKMKYGDRYSKLP